MFYIMLEENAAMTAVISPSPRTPLFPTWPLIIHHYLVSKNDTNQCQ